MSTASIEQPIRPPSWLMLALEARAPVELASSVLFRTLLRGAPRGDGHPVLVLPGLAASDRSTAPLRGFLADQGHAVSGWGLGRNNGPHDHRRYGVVRECEILLRQMHADTGRKVSLIGWSLGGVFAREIAKLAPEAVRQVVTLASPFAGPPAATNAARVYEWLSGDRVRKGGAPGPDGLHLPPPVPTTSIFTRNDGIVAWRSCMNPSEPGGQAENIEIEATHMGIGVNPIAWWIVAERLAQAEGAWKPFERIGTKRLISRDPERPDWFAAFR